MDYRDRTGKQIEAGMILRSTSGQIREVFECSDQSGKPDLGIIATNPDYLKNHPFADIEYYSLNAIDLREWLIIDAENP